MGRVLTASRSMATNYNFGAANELIGQNKVLIHVIIARPLRLRVISRTVHILSNIMTGVSWMGTFMRHRGICDTIFTQLCIYAI